MITTYHVPPELDWVLARSVCTVAKVFNQLCDEIDADVAAMNSARHLGTDSLFQAKLHEDGLTLSVGQPNVIPRTVTQIRLVADSILVTHQPAREPEWSARVSLNNEGRCALRVDGGLELEHWQFRKKALEGLFFGDWA